MEFSVDVTLLAGGESHNWRSTAVHWNTSLLPAGSPFVALRKDFERQLGLNPEPAFAAMSVLEHADRWVLSLDLPGVNLEDIHVTWNDGCLVIEGERKAARTEGAKELFNDRSFAGFRRVLKVRDAVDVAGIDASLDNGVLTLIIPRKPEAVPAKIAVRTREV
jgi:HSP20 family protein